MAENISIQRSTCNCNILGLTDTVALLANEARLFRLRVFFGACSIQNKVGDPQFFFCLFSKSRTLPFCVASFKKMCAWELLGANVLKTVIIFALHWLNFPNLNSMKAPPSCIPCWMHTTKLFFQNYDNKLVETISVRHWGRDFYNIIVRFEPPVFVREVVKTFGQ